MTGRKECHPPCNVEMNTTSSRFFSSYSSSPSSSQSASLINTNIPGRLCQCHSQLSLSPLLHWKCSHAIAVAKHFLSLTQEISLEPSDEISHVNLLGWSRFRYYSWHANGMFGVRREKEMESASALISEKGWQDFDLIWVDKQW